MSTERSSLWLNLCLVASISVVGYVVWSTLFPTIRLKGNEAKAYVGSMNRAQQAYYLETNKFVTETSDLSKLFGIKQEAEKFSYIIPGVALAYRAIPNEKEPRVVVSIAVPKTPNLRSYVGIVWTPQGVRAKAEESGITTIAVLCEAEKSGMTGAPPPLPVEEKRDVWSELLGFFTRITQKQQPTVNQEAPSFEQATSISPIRDENGLLKEIPCPQGFRQSS